MEDRDQALVHIKLVAALPGYWELRALQRLDTNRMSARGSFFLITTGTPEHLILEVLGEEFEKVS